MKKDILKKAAAGILAAAVLTGFAGCDAGGSQSSADSDGKLKIISTVFTPYDFAKQIAGDNAELTILLPPGSDSHSYEPTPKEILAVESCDIFLYIGGENEQWAEKILAGSNTEDVKAVKLIDSVDELLAEAHEHEHGETEHNHDYDRHIWTSPKNAKLMVNAIYEAICEADPENKDAYTENKQAYCEKLDELDSKYKAAVEAAKSKTVIFGDKFPFRYLAHEYGLDCHAAFASCSDESEPSAAKMTELIEKIKSENIPVVYYLEFSSRKIADALCESTGATALMLHSCHNVSKEELESGATYISLMEQNLENLKVAFAGKTE